MKRMVKIATCFLAVLLLAGCAKTPKLTIHSSGMYRNFSMREAVDESTYIVYGKVVSKGRPVELQFTAGGKKAGCRKVTLEVIDCAKGGLKAGDKIFYYEMGGETKNFKYVYDGELQVSKGENVLAFLVDDGEPQKYGCEVYPYVLSPWIRIIEDTNDFVRIEKKNLPEAMASKVTKTEGYNEVADIPFASLFEAARQMAEGTYVDIVGEPEGEPADEAAGNAA